ncbi:MAG: hypothetical protein WCY82_04810 [Desulfotomaculaceae bacterium]
MLLGLLGMQEQGEERVGYLLIPMAQVLGQELPEETAEPEQAPLIGIPLVQERW